MTDTKKNKGGRPRKQTGELRSASTRTDLTLSEKQELALEARLQGVSEAEYVRRRLGFGAPAPGIRSTSSIISDLEKRGVDIAALLSQDTVQAHAQEAGLEPATFVRRMLEFSASSPQKRNEAAIVSELNNLWQQFRALGNNANQISISKHTSRSERIAWEDAIAKLDKLSAQAEAAIEHVLGS